MYAALLLALALPHADDPFLQKVPELLLDGDTEATRQARKVLAESGTRKGWFEINEQVHNNLLVAAAKKGLPVLAASEARLDARAAADLRDVSRRLRGLGFTGGTTEESPLTEEEAIRQGDRLIESHRLRRLNPREAAVSAALWNSLWVEGEPGRKALVVLLPWSRESLSPSSAQVLARCVVYAETPQLRALGCFFLKSRPPGEYLPTLLKALSHPWPTARANAAEAIRKLKPDGAKAALEELLDAPPPGVPFKDKRTGKLVVRELVRINHRNCLLCHEPKSEKTDDLVQPMPGDLGFVRGDVTYLRPDFSFLLGSKRQRYDFFVRTRPATDKEVFWEKMTIRRPEIALLLKSLK